MTPPRDSAEQTQGCLWKGEETLSPYENKGRSSVLLFHLPGNIPWFPRTPWAAENPLGRHSRCPHRPGTLRMKILHLSSL